MDFGKRLQQLRKEKKMTQQDLANTMKLSRATIAGYESRGKQPDQQKLIWLSEYFNVSLDYLLGSTDIKEKKTSKIFEKESSRGDEEELSEKNKKDIAQKMRKLREEIANEDGLMLDGEILTEETKDLLLQLLEKDEIAATLNNKKYIPKKYRK